jgi:hypothetical protein
MTKQQEQRPTAKIYMFPTRPRITAGNRQPYEQQPSVQRPIVHGGSWYHQEAIDEEVDEVVNRFPYKKH